MVTDLLRNLTYRSTHCTLVSDRAPCASCCLLFLSPCNSVGGDKVMQSSMLGEVSEWMGGCACFKISQSLSNFTCKLWMMRGGILLLLVVGSKVKVNFGNLYVKPCGHSFCPLSNFTWKFWDDGRRNPIDFGSRGQRSRKNLAFCL